MFQFSGFPPLHYFVHVTVRESSSRGFPHSDIPGSQLIYNSPRLFAVHRVLRRLLMPRHSPCALFRLTLRRCKLRIVRSGASPLRNKTVVLFRSSWFSELCRLISGSLEIVLPIKVPQLLLNFLLLPCLSFLCSVFNVQERECTL